MFASFSSAISCTVVQELTRFQLTQSVARSLCDSRVSCIVAKTPFTRYNLKAESLYTRYSRLSNRLYRVNGLKHSTGCQTGLATGCSIVQPVGQPAASCKQTSNRLSGCTTGLTIGWMFVYIMQPVAKQVWQPVVSCKRTLTYSIVWYDMIWYDMIWYDMIWYDMIWYDSMRCNTIWYDTIRDNII